MVIRQLCPAENLTSSDLAPPLLRAALSSWETTCPSHNDRLFPQQPYFVQPFWNQLCKTSRRHNSPYFAVSWRKGSPQGGMLGNFPSSGECKFIPVFRGACFVSICHLAVLISGQTPILPLSRKWSRENYPISREKPVRKPSVFPACKFSVFGLAEPAFVARWGAM